MVNSPYSQDLLLGLYSLSRNYYLCGMFDEAEKICAGLIEVDEKATPARLLSAVINLELGNFSLAANHFRIASQEPEYLNQCKVGILTCFIGLKDKARASSLIDELKKDSQHFEPNLKAFFEWQAKESF